MSNAKAKSVKSEAIEAKLKRLGMNSDFAGGLTKHLLSLPWEVPIGKKVWWKKIAAKEGRAYFDFIRNHSQIQKIQITLKGKNHTFTTPPICEAFERVFNEAERQIQSVKPVEGSILPEHPFYPDRHGLMKPPAEVIYFYIYSNRHLIKGNPKKNTIYITVYEIMEILGLVKKIVKGDIKRVMAAYVRKYIPKSKTNTDKTLK